jgi:PKD repeat protein
VKYRSFIQDNYAFIGLVKILYYIYIHMDNSSFDNKKIIDATIILKDGVNQQDIKQILNTLVDHKFTTHHVGNTIKISGEAELYSNFGVSFRNTIINGKHYHTHDNKMSLPDHMKDKVVTILGLNSTPFLRSYVKHPTVQVGGTQPNITGNTFNPLDLASIYNFPPGDGTGQNVGIIELGGGYSMSDLTAYLTYLGIPGTPNVTAVSIDGGTNNTGDVGSSYEVILDIEVIMAIVPKAHINVYFAPNSDQGFYDALSAAINNNNAVSISWVASETFWAANTMTAYNSLFQTAASKNVTVCAASGDSGSNDGTGSPNVDFPAASPYVLGCGGTTLQTNANNTSITSETVWNNNSTSSATGGGYSKTFPKPSYQNNVITGSFRGVPDIAGDANPNTGYKLIFQGRPVVIGGTSAVAPLWSALVARINQNVNKSIGFMQPTLYANQNICRDIISGNNGSYNAASGWDPCTGWGSPNGVLIQNAFTTNSAPIASFKQSVSSGSSPLSVSFLDTSIGSPTSWNWNFGDGSSSVLQSPTHVFTASSNTTFTVTLTATNANGSSTATGTVLVTVTVNVPVASFTKSVSSGNSPLNVVFTDTSTGNPTTYLWNFGDGQSSSLQSPSHTYTSASTTNFIVTLTVSNTNGQSSTSQSITVINNTPVASFTTNPSSGPSPLLVSFVDTSTGVPTAWLWDFGDNSPVSSVQNPSHTFSASVTTNFVVKLTVSNTFGSSSTSSVVIVTVNQPMPVADFTYSPASGFSPLNVAFTDMSSNTPTSWLWNFGDGKSSSAQDIVHQYVTPGIYSVSLIAANAGGGNKIIKANIINIVYLAPVANFVGFNLSGQSPLTVSLNDTSTNTPVIWRWNFGDGNNSGSLLQNPQHTYTKSGIYSVSLTVTNPYGSSSVTKQGYVTVL